MTSKRVAEVGVTLVRSLIRHFSPYTSSRLGRICPSLRSGLSLSRFKSSTSVLHSIVVHVHTEISSSSSLMKYSSPFAFGGR